MSKKKGEQKVDYSGRGIRLPDPLEWVNVRTDLPSRDYMCGHCSKAVSSAKGYPAKNNRAHIYICHRCKHPTFVRGNRQVPGAPVGASLQHLPDSVEKLWNEARRAMTVDAPTLVVMACRKMLMNVAVDQGARPGAKYSHYVDWLGKNKLAPGNEEWIERIHELGGQANHAIAPTPPEDAEDIMTFLQNLLRMVYEFPAELRRKQGTEDTDEPQ